MRGRPQPSPKAAEVLAKITDMLDAGQSPTLGKLFRALGRSKNSVHESIVRLERDKWIKRPKHRDGCRRPISLKGV